MSAGRVTAIAALAWGPIVANAHLRQVYLRTMAHYAAGVAPTDIGLVGNSFTTLGSSWSWRLAGQPFSAINLGVPDYSTRQISKAAYDIWAEALCAHRADPRRPRLRGYRDPSRLCAQASTAAEPAECSHA